MLCTLASKLIRYNRPVGGILIVILLSVTGAVFAALPLLTGVVFLSYIISLWFVTTWLLYVFLQRYSSYKLDDGLWSIATKHQYDVCDGFKLSNINVRSLASDIDRHFIRRWFRHISNDETFDRECILALDAMLSKLFQVLLRVRHEAIVHGFLNVYLKHLKEYRRALKRHQKYDGKLRELFCYSHNCTNSRRMQEYFLHNLTTNVLNEFINWDLYNSLPCRILVSIVAKKLILAGFDLISNPSFINYAILGICLNERQRTELQYSKYSLVEIEDNVEKEDTVDSVANVAPIPSPKSVSKEASPRRIISSDVKVYEPRSCKIASDSSYDLKSVTLGEDILSSLEMSPKERNVQAKQTPVIHGNKTLLDEVKQMTTIEGFKTSMKPISNVTVNTLHNIKDFHFQDSTVGSVVKPVSQATTNALHKIGGLQDEAAGMVEGILDFGRTKIRKGLRLTGLEATEQSPKRKPLIKEPPVIAYEADEMASSESRGSPEPEYEDTADLATSIAKLRTLLEQKSSESTISTPSPMPADDLIINAEDMDQDSVVPRVYKLCAKTATGMIYNTLNTIKTALPTNDRPDDGINNCWRFVEDGYRENSFFERVSKLVAERSAFCTIDTAYDAIDTLDPFDDGQTVLPSALNEIPFEDELDDFEVKVPMTKALVDILCELLSDIDDDVILTQEPIVKSVLLLVGPRIEAYLRNTINQLITAGLSNVAISLPKSGEILVMNKEQYINLLVESLKDNKILESAASVLDDSHFRESVTLLVQSLQTAKMNKDMVLQLFEMVAVHLIRSSKLSSIGADDK